MQLGHGSSYIRGQRGQRGHFRPEACNLALPLRFLESLLAVLASLQTDLVLKDGVFGLSADEMKELNIDHII
jgi:hypothetical protein